MNTASTTTDPDTSLFERAMERARRDEGSGTDRTRTRLLDAAFEQFCITGIGGSSVEEIAKRAGMARITVYRKFDSKDALVDAVIMREFQDYLNQFKEQMAGAHTAADRVVAGFVTSLQTLGRNRLIRSLLETEPAMVPAFVGGGQGKTMAAVRDFVTGQLAREQQAGTISEQVPVLEAADMIVRITGSFLTTPSDLVDYDDADGLAKLAQDFLLPMLGLNAG